MAITPESAPERSAPSDFIRDAVREDLASGRFDHVHTRFPPEPNAYLHIGHAKALWIDYGIAQEFGGQFNLRFDDTNPEKEEQEFVDAIIEDVKWVLGAGAEGRRDPGTEGIDDLRLTIDDSGSDDERRATEGIDDLQLTIGDSGSNDERPNDRTTDVGPSRIAHRASPPSGQSKIQNLKSKVPIRGPFFASDYFDQMYAWAIQLIEKRKAYVCDLSPQELIDTRGTPTSPGSDSPYRNRSVEENLDLFKRMNSGEFPEGSRTLRAKIDMAHPNILMRDPVMYRIKHAPHHRQGEKWDIYPMYDWAHGLEDSIEGITHSLCSLEYENHRPLYDWFLDELGIYHPRQIEFVRASLTYTVMSKRRFIELVNGGYVNGYDDPRLPTLAGARRRGYTPEAIKDFCMRIGVGGRSAVEARVDMALLQDCVREDLNRRAPRVMGVLNPVKLVITNYPEGQVEELECVNNPEDPSAGSRLVPFSRELFIEAEDFMAEPAPKFFRLSPGKEVRLRYAYFVTCVGFNTDEHGQVTDVLCTYDPATKGGDAPDGRRVKATLHWVSAAHAVPCEVRLYDHLFVKEDPDEVEDGQSYLDNLNPDSLKVVTAKLEPSVVGAKAGDTFQFERMGYFCVDPDSSSPDSPITDHRSPSGLVFNRTATLRDTWANIQKRG